MFGAIIMCARHLHRQRFPPGCWSIPLPTMLADSLSTHSMQKIIFRDIDGTLCHYNVRKYASVGEKDENTGLCPCASLDRRSSAQLLKLPPSTTGAAGGACRCRAAPSLLYATLK